MTTPKVQNDVNSKSTIALMTSVHMLTFIKM